MKKFRQIKNQAAHQSSSGFTLVEMMMVVGIFMFIFVGVMVAVQLFGLRIYTLNETKLIATQGGRAALNALRDSIREGKIVYVGNCSSIGTNTFAMLGVTNVPQVGNALIVYPSTNTSYYTVYYLDTSTTTNTLYQFNISNLTVTYTQPLATYVTNLNVFTAEDFAKNIATNYSSLDNREVIHVQMQFSQWEYPIAFVGGHSFNAYDYYQLNTRVFRRAWN